MKKKQLKEELELANATLELSMVALRKLDEVLQEAKAQGFVPKNLNDKTEPQAGDKIVESDNNDSWFTKNNDGTYTFPFGAVANFSKWDNQLKKETPLSDLNKEVQEELSKKNDLSCKSTDSTNCESYVIQAKEAVDKFMPLVNGWVKCQPFAEGSKIFEHEGNGHIDQSFWKWNIVNYRKAAIKVAIAHFELIQKQGGWLTHIDCVQIIGELTKMLSQ